MKPARLRPVLFTVLLLGLAALGLQAQAEASHRPVVIPDFINDKDYIFDLNQSVGADHYVYYARNPAPIVKGSAFQKVVANFAAFRPGTGKGTRKDFEAKIGKPIQLSMIKGTGAQDDSQRLFYNYLSVSCWIDLDANQVYELSFDDTNLPLLINGKLRMGQTREAVFALFGQPLGTSEAPLAEGQHGADRVLCHPEGSDFSSIFYADIGAEFRFIQKSLYHLTLVAPADPSKPFKLTLAK